MVVNGDPLDGVARLEQRLGVGAGREWREASARARAEREARRWRDRNYYQAHVDLTAVRRDDQPVVDLRIDAQLGPLVELVFEGDPLPKARRTELVPVEREGAVDEDLLEDSKRRVEQFLRAQGYWKAVADYRRAQADGRLKVVFTVNRGPLYEIDRRGRERRGPGGARPGERPAGPAAGPALLRRQLLERDVAVVLRHLQELGHAQAKVARRVDETGDASATRAALASAIAVEQGPRTLVGAIRLEGQQALDEGTLRQAMQLRPGGAFFAPGSRPTAGRSKRSTATVASPTQGCVAAEPAADGPLADVIYRITRGRTCRRAARDRHRQRAHEHGHDSPGSRHRGAGSQSAPRNWPMRSAA